MTYRSVRCRAALIPALTLALLAGGAGQVTAQNTNQWCDKYPGSPWFPSCVVDTSFSGSGVVKYYHAVALPYRLWTKKTSGAQVTYYGYVNDTNWKSTFYSCADMISHQQDRADNPGIARFQGSTWSCI